MRASEAGRAELFWTETLEGQHGGFSQDKAESFSVSAGDEFRDYRIAPFWHAAGKVVRLRFDPPNTGSFEIAWIRILDSPTPAVETTAWDFRQGDHGWQSWQQIDRTAATPDGLRLKLTGNEPVLASPLLKIPVEDLGILAIRMSVSGGEKGRVFCVQDAQSGRESLDFRLIADGRMHTYNLEMATLSRWRDHVVMLGIQPSDAAGAEVCIESVVLAAEPVGPPEMQVAFFGSTSGIQRVDRPFDVTALVQNPGGPVIEDLNVALTVPEGGEILDGSERRVERLSRHLPQTVHWQVRTARPGRLPLALKAAAAGVSPVRADAAVEITPAPNVPAGDYVPEPRPVRSDVDVGVFYFPGWHDWSRWQPILDFPDRKPILGWYDESNPECADWQIKWAVEHGVRFFMVDWYWIRGNRHLEHWLHQAYSQARYRRYLQWAVMWANHNPPGSHSREDWREVTQYWIDHYFSMDEYYRIDGRPAVFIWSPANIRNDLNGSQAAAELYAMSQQMARQAGYPGIYFVAMSSHESDERCVQLKQEGYEAFTSYHGFQLAESRAGSTTFPFSQVVETSPEVWRAADERASGLTYLPIVDTGWSSEPWHRNQARVIHGRTPELFGRLCRLAADYARQNNKRIIAVGPWNEWGEGSYIEPYAKYGFGDLDQMRDAFCPPAQWPPNVVPADLGRGPYDLPPTPLRTAWDFEDPGDAQGWTHNSALRIQVDGGSLRGESVGGDPVLQGPRVLVEADRYRRLLVRMSSSRNDTAQLFWSTTASPVSESNSVRFDVAGDGSLREYSVDLRASRRWRGVITSLRLDPATGPGTRFAIDSIRLEP